MSAYIKSYRLLNFQSWDDSSSEIKLESNMVNIIEGANETGKSVLYKVLYNFCFPGYWDPSELIRRGCNTGILILNLEDSSTILYALSASSYTYVLVEANGEKSEWTNQGCPDAIVGRLGLILDKETQVILNIIDSDVALPFIKTSPKFNASLIRSIVEPEGMTEFFQNLADTTVRIENAHHFFVNKANTLWSQISNIPMIDPIHMQNQKVDIDNCIILADSLNTSEELFQKLFLELTTIITVVNDPSEYKALLDVLEGVRSLIVLAGNLSQLSTLVVSEIQPVDYIAEYIEMLQKVIECLNDGMRLQTIKDTTPRPIGLADVKDSIQLLESLYGLYEDATEIQKIFSSAPKVCYCEDLTQPMKLLTTLLDTVDTAMTLSEQQKSCNEVEETMHNLETEIKQIANEVGVCPTCGQLLRGTLC